LIGEEVIAQNSAKGLHGKIDRAEFSPGFHSHLVKCSMALLPTFTSTSMRMAKRAIFVFTLEMLN